MGFEFVKSWDGWLVRSPDNIQFVLRPDQEDPIDGNTGIVELVELYTVARSAESDDLFFGPQIYLEIESTGDEVVMRINEETEITTSYAELKDETEHLLRESFEAMDAQDSAASQTGQLQKYGSVSEVYTELIENRS